MVGSSEGTSLRCLVLHGIGITLDMRCGLSTPMPVLHHSQFVGGQRCIAECSRPSAAVEERQYTQACRLKQFPWWEAAPSWI